MIVNMINLNIDYQILLMYLSRKYKIYLYIINLLLKPVITYEK